MANPWAIAGMTAAITGSLNVLGWFLIPIISTRMIKLFSDFSFDAPRKLRELEIDTIPDLKKTLRDVEEQKMLRETKGEGCESDLNTLNKLSIDLRSALYEAEDILYLIDYQRIEQRVIRRSRFGRCKDSTRSWLLWFKQSLYRRGFEFNLPISNTSSTSSLSNRYQSLLSWSTKAIMAVRCCLHRSFHVLREKNYQNHDIAIDSFLSTIGTKSLRKRIEHIENIANDSKKSHLLSQKISSFEVSVKDTNKESSNRQVQIKDMNRRIERIVFGRDELREQICGMFRKGPTSSRCENYFVVGIWGIAGSGKSTLAQYICDYEKKTQDTYFNIIMFSHVSTTFSVDKIFRDMLEEMTQDRLSNTKDPKILKREFERKLRGERFLLVLDDLWANDENPEEKDTLLDALKAGMSGSVILVTAQKEDAAASLGAHIQDQISIPNLEEREYLSLFMHHALQGAVHVDRKFEFERIGKKIVQKLHSSPIAAVAVARRLQMNKNIGFWETTANLDTLNKTMGALWWSYKQLHEGTRRCFVYCRFFPRGYTLTREELVRMWMAQGFVKASNATDDIDDLGNRYFEELRSSSFLQVQRTGAVPERFKIHTLLHELAERVAGTDFSIDMNGWQQYNLLDVHHLFIDICIRADLRVKFLDMRNLRTLIVVVEYNRNMDKFFQSIFIMLTKLRVLIVKINCSIIASIKFPESIGHMKHLRYLSVSSEHSLELTFPDTLNKLYHMQTLDVGDFKISCAESMSNNLIHLRHCSSSGNFPNIGRLTSLQTMRNFRVRTEQGYELKQLKDLNNLRGTLVIKGLEIVGSKVEAAEADLASKRRLKNLELEFDQNNGTPNVEEQVLEGLCPHMDLEELTIRYYIGSCYPSWILNRDIQVLHLDSCVQLLSIPEDNTILIHLRALRISCCPWKRLPHNMVRLESLKNLYIFGCSRIKLLPRLPRYLEEITIQRCYALNITFEDKEHNNWEEVKHVPNISIGYSPMITP